MHLQVLIFSGILLIVHFSAWLFDIYEVAYLSLRYTISCGMSGLKGSYTFNMITFTLFSCRSRDHFAVAMPFLNCVDLRLKIDHQESPCNRHLTNVFIEILMYPAINQEFRRKFVLNLNI